MMKYMGTWLIASILLAGSSVFAAGPKEEAVDTTAYDVYYGKVVDANTGRTLPFATIEAAGSNVATVTNIDGDFTIKIAKGSDVSQLKVSYLGFANQTVELSQFRGGRTRTIALAPTSIQLQEITIRPQDALQLISDVLANTRENYSPDPMMGNHPEGKELCIYFRGCGGHI
jgi:hypothetical protein